MENLPIPCFYCACLCLFWKGWRLPWEASQFELCSLISGSYPMKCGVKHEALYIYIIYCVRIIGEGVCKTKRIAEVLNRFKSMCLSM